MGALRDTLRSWIDAGCEHATSDRRRYQTRASNVVGLAFAVMSLPYVPIEWMMGAPFLALTTLASCAIYPLAIPLNEHGYSRTARAIPLIAGTLMAWGVSLVMTPASQVQLVLFMVGLWPFMLFDARKEWPHLVGLQLLPAAVYVSLNAGFTPQISAWQPSPGLLATYASVTPVTVFVLNSVFLFLFYLRNQANEDRLVALVDTLEQSHRAASAGERAKTEFLAVMSHEIRTPLNGVLGCAELMRGEQLTKDQEHWLGVLTSSAEYLLELMTNIIEYSQLDGSKAVAHTSQIEVLQLVEDTVATFAEAAHGKGLELWVRAAADVPTGLVLDPGRLRLVLSTLVHNAVKFTDTGHVEVSLDYEPGADADGTLKLQVADTGVGIEPAAHEHIFSLFTQVDTFARRREGGIGLGLCLSKAAADVMRGTLSVHSTPGAGSRFTLTVPVKQSDIAHPSTHLLDDLADLATKSVRVLTRDVEFGRALRSVLRRWGHALLDEQNSAAADILLLDSKLLHVPESDADLDVAGQLSAFRRGAEEVVVLASAATPKLQTKVPYVTVRRYLRRGTWFDALMQLFADSPRSQRRLPRAASNPANPAEQLAADPTQAAAAPPSTNGKAPAAPPGASLEPGSGPVESGPTASAPVYMVQKLLIADDQVTNQRILKKLAERLAREIRVVENGELAVQAWEDDQPDAILMDIQMPVMDGLEATRKIRALEANTVHTPIIAVTANALPEQRAEGLAAGIDEYLTKPVRIGELREALERVSARSKQGAHVA